MSRRVLLCRQTWKDRKFEKTFKKLDARKQQDLLERLANLSDLLARVSHPASHPEIQKYRPTAYSAAFLKTGQLLEYRLDAVSRVIAKYPAHRDSDDILLLIAITVDHDHERMKSLIQQYRSEIDGWRDEDEG